MKLRNYIGKRVEMVWRDPFDWREEGDECIDQIQGADPVPTWTHIGVVEGVAEGWVRLRYGGCSSSQTKPVKEGVMVYEDLVVSVTCLEPVNDPPLNR